MDWDYHDKNMQKILALYKKANNKIKNHIQEYIDTFKFNNENIYEIADKKRINQYIDEWNDKGLLKGYFGYLVNNIRKRTKVTNMEILELLVYASYVEAQSDIEKEQNNIIKDEVNYYYEEGQTEVIKAKKIKRKPSIIEDAIFLALLSELTSNGYSIDTYIETRIFTEAQIITKQIYINITQGNDLNIYAEDFTAIFNRNLNKVININNNKISGTMDNIILGLDTMAKCKGMEYIDKDAKYKILAHTDERTTKMCDSLDGQVFSINKENEFYRYSQSHQGIIKVKCRGMVLGLNLPPINDNFHWCRSTITYQV